MGQNRVPKYLQSISYDKGGKNIQGKKKKNIQGEKVSSLGGAGTTGHCLFQFRYFPEKFGEP